MTKTLAFFDRLLVFILGILLLCFGFIPLTYFWDIPYVSEWTQQVDPAVIGNLPYRSWYNTALIVGAVVLGIVGLWAVIANVRSRGFSTREITAADAEHGTTEINVKRVAEAACHHLATNPMINSTKTDAPLPQHDCGRGAFLYLVADRAHQCKGQSLCQDLTAANLPARPSQL